MTNNFKPEYNLLRDAYLGKNMEPFIKQLEYLAFKLAKKEDWDFKDPKYKDPFKPLPILYNYINFTYDRLLEENKIAITADEEAMCFNTGLQTPLDSDIYAYFVRNNINRINPEKQKWYFIKFCDEYDRDLRKFPKLPDIAEYIENASDLVFDRKLLPIRVNYEHIIVDNRSRFESVSHYEDHELRQILEGAIRRTEERVRRNYKIAIPQYYTDKLTGISKIQLLLPLCLKDPQKTDLALVVERDGMAYVAKTVLPLDWAYMNSRRIVRPDADWITSI